MIAVETGTMRNGDGGEYRRCNDTHGDYYVQVMAAMLTAHRRLSSIFSTYEGEYPSRPCVPRGNRGIDRIGSVSGKLVCEVV
jgi:hypothetical protein